MMKKQYLNSFFHIHNLISSTICVCHKIVLYNILFYIYIFRNGEKWHCLLSILNLHILISTN